jgi:hypothetical protein
LHILQSRHQNHHIVSVLVAKFKPSLPEDSLFFLGDAGEWVAFGCRLATHWMANGWLIASTALF